MPNSDIKNHADSANQSKLIGDPDTEKYMAKAIQLARKGAFTARPNPRVGCVLVKDQKIIGQGWHQKSGQAHAEINALNQAGGEAKGAECYVTLEPCCHYGKTPPCSQALIKAGVSKVVIASLDPNPKVAGKGKAELQQAGIQVITGLLQAEAQGLNPGFMKRMQTGMPYIRCKLAMSLDGRTAMADGTSQWITSPASRSDVQKLRARHDAIVTGSQTVINDDPSFLVRLAEISEWPEELNQQSFSQPIRILLDRRGRISTQAKLFQQPHPIWWYQIQSSHTTQDKKADFNLIKGLTYIKNKTWPKVKLAPEPEPEQTGQQSIKEIAQSQLELKALARQWADEGFNEILLESGHQLAGAFLQAGLIDELIVYIAPKLMGNQAMGLIALPFDQMSQAIDLTLLDYRQIGPDHRFVWKTQ